MTLTISRKMYPSRLGVLSVYYFMLLCEIAKVCVCESVLCPHFALTSSLFTQQSPLCLSLCICGGSGRLVTCVILLPHEDGHPRAFPHPLLLLTAPSAATLFLVNLGWESYLPGVKGHRPARSAPTLQSASHTTACA